jgi:bromodomain and PHD finger-containing protein 1
LESPRGTAEINVTVGGFSQFLQHIVAYWTIKRHARSGVPLLRRLQTGAKRNDVKVFCI